ncbi:MAG: 6-bladed beta-propeller [Bacteroidales bacterium]
MKRLYSISMSVLILFSCQDKSDKGQGVISDQESNAFFTIELESTVEQTKQLVNLSEIANAVEYIYLDNHDGKELGSIRDIHFTDRYVFISHRNNTLLTQYDRDGKFIRSIGKKGEGNGAYSLLSSFDVNCKDELIYIKPVRKNNILVFDFSGNYIETINLADDIFFSFRWINDSSFIFFAEPIKGYEKYIFWEKGSEGDLRNFIKNYITWDESESTYNTRDYDRTVFYRLNDKLHLKGWYNDTVYTYTNMHTLVPKYFIDFGKYKLPEELIIERNPKKFSDKHLWYSAQESNRFVFVRYSSFFPIDTLSTRGEHIYYDKITQKSVALKSTDRVYGFKNDLDNGPNFTPQFIRDSMAYHIFHTADSTPSEDKKGAKQEKTILMTVKLKD